MSPSEQRFVVFVDFGAQSVEDGVPRIQGHAHLCAATLIAIDTSQNLRLRGGEPVNEAFEFSGYQYGLERALELAGPAGEDALVEIAFVNGTALTAHLRPMLSYCLSRAFGRRRPDAARSRVSGFVHRCGHPRTAVASLGFYIPTFAFSLSGTARQLARVRLYDPAAVGAEGLARKYGEAGPDYDRSVEQWLSPTSLWRGWYQALPGRPLDDATRYRKRLAIYLEHSMPRWLASQGVDCATPAALGERATVTTLMWMDKLLVNALKVRHRLTRALRDRCGARDQSPPIQPQAVSRDRRSETPL